MQNFEAELRRLSKKYELAELEGKDFYKEHRCVCKHRKNVEWEAAERWTICTHSAFDDSPYTWACMIHHCPFVSEGIKDAHIFWNKKRKERIA